LASTSGSKSTWDRLAEAIFEIGGDDQIAGLRKQFPAAPSDRAEKDRLDAKWKDFVKQAGIRIGTLLKTDNISFLIGAGASKSAGGVLLGGVPKEIEGQLLEKGIKDDKVKGWLKLFYYAVHTVENKAGVQVADTWVVSRSKDLPAAPQLQANFERVLACLFRWAAVLRNTTDAFTLEGAPKVSCDFAQVRTALEESKRALVKVCKLPTKHADADAFRTHRDFLKKVLTRPLNLKRANVFTLNYDTLIEQAADADGIVLIDGFVGTVRRTLRPESFDQDLYFPAETTEGRVHRLERVIHLYKLHGSINWVGKECDWDNPYGVTATQGEEPPPESVLVYPTPSKFGDVLGMPYAELFRRFAASVVRRQSTLFVIGYGFGDDHVNAIIRQALAIPSFSLVIVDPCVPQAGAGPGIVSTLRNQKDRRVWIISGESLGNFVRFVDILLPDLHDEEILGRVMKTFNALDSNELQVSADDHVK
jgi:hypothetical protein